jgi:hypothetical protein
MPVRTAHEMKAEILATLRPLAKKLGVETFSVNDQTCRHFLRGLGRAIAQLALESGAPPPAAVGLVVEGVQNCMTHKDGTVEEALGAKPAGEA